MNKGVLVVLVVSVEADVVDVDVVVVAVVAVVAVVVVVIDTAVTPVCTTGVLLLMMGCFLSQFWFFILKYIHNKTVKMGDGGP